MYYHRSKLCPLPNRDKVVKRLPNHSVYHHKLKRDSDYYKACLKAAITSSPSKFVENAPRKSLSTKQLSMTTETNQSMPSNLETVNSSERLYSLVEVSTSAADDTCQYSVAYDNVDNDNVKVLTVEQCPEQSMNDGIDFEGIDVDENNAILVSSQIDNSVEVNAGGSEIDDPTYVLSVEDRLDNFQLPSEMENLFKKFLSFLISPGGGKWDKASSENTVSEVRKICKVLNTVDFTKLSQRDVIRQEYLLGYCKSKGHAAHSIRKYLLSLKSFCTFVIIDDFPIKNVSSYDVLKTKFLAENWKSSYKKPSRERYYERQEEHHEMIVTPDQVSQYFNSSNAILAQKLLKQLENTTCSVKQIFARSGIICLF